MLYDFLRLVVGVLVAAWLASIIVAVVVRGWAC